MAKSNKSDWDITDLVAPLSILYSFKRSRAAVMLATGLSRTSEIRIGKGESDSIVGDRNTRFQQMLLDYQKKHDERWIERRRIADDPSGVENQSRWVQYMRWAALFDRKDKRIIYLASLMARPVGIRTATQPSIRRVCRGSRSGVDSTRGKASTA